MTIVKKIRVLHVVARLDRGGTETWLVRVLSHLDRDRFQFDFAVNTDLPAALDDRVREFGCGISSCAPASVPYRYSRRMRTLLQAGERYSIVHSHFDPCGFPLRFASQSHVPVRIAHCHNPGMEFRGKPIIARRLLAPVTRDWIRRFATCGLATSRVAGESLFGPIRGFESLWRVQYCGLALDEFDPQPTESDLRKALSIPTDAWVIGHVGKFCADRQKNQEFLLKIGQKMIRREPATRIVFVGDGQRRPAVEELAARLGLRDHVMFLGSRPDVPRLLTEVFDVFAFPSRYEGLGVALVEAQAAGLPCLVAEHLPNEAVVVPSLVSRCRLSEPASEWARKFFELRNAPLSVSRDEALSIVRESRFNVVDSANRLQQFYKEVLGQTDRRGIN